MAKVSALPSREVDVTLSNRRSSAEAEKKKKKQKEAEEIEAKKAARAPVAKSAPKSALFSFMESDAEEGEGGNVPVYAASGIMY